MDNFESIAIFILIVWLVALFLHVLGIMPPPPTDRVLGIHY